MATVNSFPEWPTNCYAQKICVLACLPPLRRTDILLRIVTASMKCLVIFFMRFDIKYVKKNIPWVVLLTQLFSDSRLGHQFSVLLPVHIFAQNGLHHGNLHELNSTPGQGGRGVQGYCNTRYFWHQIPIYPNLGQPVDTKYRKDRDTKSKCTKLLR